MPIAVEPRQKQCAPWWRTPRGKCGRCANCLNSDWNRTWRSLGPEWQAWVVSQFLLTLRWADETASEHRAEFLAGPSMSSYVYR